MVRTLVALGACALIGAAAAISGCALERLTVPAGNPGIDAAAPPVDGGLAVDATTALDAPMPPEIDAAVVPPTDSGTCTPRCDANVAISCDGPVEVHVACDPDRCVADAGGARCESLFCTPDAARCSEDGAAVVTCSAAGDEETSAPCPRGCDPGTTSCRAPRDCGRADDGTIAAPTMMRINLCGTGNDHDRDDDGTAAMRCTYASGGEDALLRLTVDRPGRYTFDVRDAPGGNDVDPIVYVRTACGDRDSEVGCDDDGGAAGRDSLLVLDLAAGEYFLVVDSYDGSSSSTDCGAVDVSVTRS